MSLVTQSMSPTMVAWERRGLRRQRERLVENVEIERPGWSVSNGHQTDDNNTPNKKYIYYSS